MAWKDLGAEIAEEFADLSGWDDRLPKRAFRSTERHRDPIQRQWEAAQASRRTWERRRAAHRGLPPCGFCGRKIERLPPCGPLPDYCADKCRRDAAQLARRADPLRRRAEQDAESGRRRARRAQRAATRLPCPHCGGKVERVGATAKLPTYCTPKCMRAAKCARWHAKHGQDHNARRRKAPVKPKADGPSG
jgi:hypothetical protein